MRICICKTPFQISDLLKALAERRPRPPDPTHTIDPGNISATISALKDTRGTFRSRAVLPANISQLSEGPYLRWDHHLSESSPAPDAAQESGRPRPTTATCSPVALLQLLERSKTLPSEGERFTKPEIHPDILGVGVWTKQFSVMPPTVSTQTGQLLIHTLGLRQTHDYFTQI